VQEFDDLPHRSKRFPRRRIAGARAVIFLLDNYDSFTWNLVQAFERLGAEVEVARNDELSVDAILAREFSGIVLSPGPGRPQDAGVQAELLAKLPDDAPLLGVCLGHQGLVEHHGGSLELDPIPAHGRSSFVRHDGSPLFAELPNPFAAGRYHSLRAVEASLPRELRACAWTDDGVVMAVRHVTLPRFGVQFHPESILTPDGGRLLARFLELAGERLVTR
jgi:anthranilate synthase/aminodeoxychorismate synthase-like glutamine amidotransferase